MALTLHNPHSLLAVLQTRPQDVVEVRLSSRNPGGAWSEVADRLAGRRVPVSFLKPHEKSRRRAAASQNAGSGGAGRTAASFAVVKPRDDVPLESLFGQQTHGLFLALDCLQDPHNVGAIFRTAAFFGVNGIVVTKDRSAPLNSTVYDVASGGLEYVPFSQQANLSRALEAAKAAGLWVLGTSERAETDFRDVPRDRPWLLVLGNEEKGMRRLTEEKCDAVCRIAPRTPIDSLNVSVAAGILIARFA